MANEHGTIGQGGELSSPSPATSAVFTLFTSATLAASGNWSASDVISVRDARKIHLFIKYSVGASGSAARGQIRLHTSPVTTEPAVGADSWYAPAVLDATPTPTVLAGTVVTGEDFTMQPEWGVHIAYPLAITLGPTSDAATDEIRMKITCAVEGDRWFYLAAHELGDTAHPGDLEVTYTLSL